MDLKIYQQLFKQMTIINSHGSVCSLSIDFMLSLRGIYEYFDDMIIAMKNGIFLHNFDNDK